MQILLAWNYLQLKQKQHHKNTQLIACKCPSLFFGGINFSRLFLCISISPITIRTVQWRHFPAYAVLHLTVGWLRIHSSLWKVISLFVLRSQRLSDNKTSRSGGKKVLWRKMRFCFPQVFIKPQTGQKIGQFFDLSSRRIVQKYHIWTLVLFKCIWERQALSIRLIHH